MSRRRNNRTSPLTVSRAFQSRHFYRLPQPRPYFDQLQSNTRLRHQAKNIRRNLRSQIHRSPQAKKLSLISQAVHGYKQVNRCMSKWSRLLSWRADQKQSSGGRKRAPRSQREKAASQQKFFKYCN